MINSTAKFVVLASAFRANLSNETNLRRHVDVRFTLDANGFQHKDVLGYYREDGQMLGKEELSLAIPCKTSQQIKMLARIFCDCYKQDCIAVWNRDSNTLWLADKEGHVFSNCGNMRMSPNAPDAQAWTYCGGFYWYAE